jgi:hypothetical protein
LLGKSYRETLDEFELYDFNVEVCGHMSNVSCEELQNELKFVLGSITRSISLLERDKVILPALYVDGFITIQRVESIENNKDFIQRCLDVYYLKPGKKDSIEKRLYNAIHLLAEADRQENSSVLLALSFSAIEALMCSQTTGITEELSSNVATLLEPNASERIEAIDAIKKLYNKRSEILHGAKLDHESELARQSRKLAAGCLKAVTEWLDCNQRFGIEQPDRSDFLSEIRSAKISGHQVVDISENLRECLPDRGYF